MKLCNSKQRPRMYLKITTVTVTRGRALLVARALSRARARHYAVLWNYTHVYFVNYCLIITTKKWLLCT